MTYHDRAEIIPGRSATRSKAPGSMWPLGAGPTHAFDAQGAQILADDGRWYLDTLAALGAISLGYRRGGEEPVTSLPSAAEVYAAEAILEHVAPWASRVVHVRTGSEATTGALMVARRATGRRTLWRLLGSYHGWHPHWQDQSLRETRWFGVGEVPSAEDLWDAAAVFVEPPRWQRWTVGWLHAVADSARRAGALMIVDEMIYGGRFALGGACEIAGLVPDLACFGKALGNGAPVACIAGGDVLAEYGTAVSGTYSGHAGSLLAMCDVIDRYVRDDVVADLNARGHRLWSGLREVVDGVPGVHLEGAPVHLRVRFENGERAAAFSAGMVRSGIIWHPSCANVMAALTEGDVDRVVNAAGDVMMEVLRDG